MLKLLTLKRNILSIFFTNIINYIYYVLEIIKKFKKVQIKVQKKTRFRTIVNAIRTVIVVIYLYRLGVL